MELTNAEIVYLWNGPTSESNKAKVLQFARDIIAHLAAKERSVQGWAILQPNGKLIEVRLTEPKERELWTDTVNNTCQPVTITINAAGQEKADGKVEGDDDSAPAPAAPVAESAEPTRYRYAYYTGNGSTHWSLEDKIYNGGGHYLKQALYSESPADGIRKGLEMAAKACRAEQNRYVRYGSEASAVRASLSCAEDSILARAEAVEKSQRSEAAEQRAISECAQSETPERDQSSDHPNASALADALGERSGMIIGKHRYIAIEPSEMAAILAALRGKEGK